jgi:hypothetical protein
MKNLELIKDLDNTPPELEYSMQRVEAKLKSQRQSSRRYFALSLSSIVTFFIAFIIFVNSFPTFAYACGRIPLIKELVQLVTFSPSLSAAVENEYVQPIELEQTQNGITARIEYVIVDQKELDIFYSLDSDIYAEMNIIPEIIALDGSKLEGYAILSGSYGTPGDMNQITVSFSDKDMPEGMLLILKVHDNGNSEKIENIEDINTNSVEDDTELDKEHKEPESISEFTFKLEFDPDFTAQGGKITLDKSFEIDGQTLILEEAEIYPTHMRINFADSEDNTAWLKKLSFYIENEKGERFDQGSNGISATGAVDSPMMESYYLDSPFFSKSKELTLYITGTTWLDKDMETVKVDLANVEAEKLPQGVTFSKAESTEDGWLLMFEAKEEVENSFYQIWAQDYYDEQGNKYTFNSWSSHNGESWDKESGQFVEKLGVFLV